MAVLRQSAPISPSSWRRASLCRRVFVVSPIIVGVIGIAVERLLFRRF